MSEWPLPIAVIAGEQDAGINNDYIIQEVKFKNLWREKVHVISNAGHAVFIDQSVEFNNMSNSFKKFFESKCKTNVPFNSMKNNALD
ncbi:MAG: hypothetical protein H0T62_14190 [Parachlamydiaceae bacterium]|nr:hypothetical protein [Parachlamydiaceae bacterium]